MQQDGQAGIMYGVSKSGWMESDNFMEWFEKMFLPAVDHLHRTGPSLSIKTAWKKILKEHKIQTIWQQMPPRRSSLVRFLYTHHSAYVITHLL